MLNQTMLHAAYCLRPQRRRVAFPVGRDNSPTLSFSTSIAQDTDQSARHDRADRRLQSPRDPLLPRATHGSVPAPCAADSLHSAQKVVRAAALPDAECVWRTLGE